ncbi:uncharacterized protein ARMOST_06294 [Armillaria ostoyae]|uniref:Uncharacterized protein n=1 Tax=Armillaria ostoyae TaxID=47428 RepID=A0A284R2M9_ARMOS|nr:uncharacterized protein ARMOST_06294 [Armillaria ostoyae]
MELNNLRKPVAPRSKSPNSMMVFHSIEVVKVFWSKKNYPVTPFTIDNEGGEGRDDKGGRKHQQCRILFMSSPTKGFCFLDRQTAHSCRPRVIYRSDATHLLRLFDKHRFHCTIQQRFLFVFIHGHATTVKLRIVVIPRESL